MEHIRLSVSKTKTYINCPKAYQFSYILKMPKKERDYHVFGKFVHKVLEDFHLAYIAGCTDSYPKAMTKYFKEALQNEEFLGKLTPDQKAESKSILTNYLNIIKENPFNVVSCEDKFELPIRDEKVEVVLNGMIDRIQIDPDGVYHVADYKTSKTSQYLQNDYFQLLTYAFILINKHPEITKVRGSYVLVRNNFEHVTKEFEIDEIMTVVPKYLEYGYNMMTDQKFEPKTSPLCNYCDFQDSCEEGKKKKLKIGETTWTI